MPSNSASPARSEIESVSSTGALVKMQNADQSQLDELIQNLNLLLSEMAELETSGSIGATEVHTDHRASARNLLDYLALRRHDIRPMQSKLVRLGLSSLMLEARRPASTGKSKLNQQAPVGPIPAKQQTLRLKLGDTLILTRSLDPGQPPQRDSKEKLITPARIGVSQSEFFDGVKTGAPIWLDDILRRMQPHHEKKNSLLRKLHLAVAFQADA